MPSQTEKANIFKTLHDTKETFIIPNPWDAGSALLLQKEGFKALATTSAGFAQTLGKVDGGISLEEKLVHCRQLTSVTDIPITVDFENGFADSPEQAAKNILQLAETGVVGGSIEDFSVTDGIYDFNLAVERVAACVEAVSSLDFPFMLTARAEGLLRQTCNLDEAIERLLAFEKVGAHVLYAPGLKSSDEIKTVLNSVSLPVNVLAPFLPTLTFADYADLGVARVSVGGVLAAKAQKATHIAAKQMMELGEF